MVPARKGAAREGTIRERRRCAKRAMPGCDPRAAAPARRWLTRRLRRSRLVMGAGTLAPRRIAELAAVPRYHRAAVGRCRRSTSSRIVRVAGGGPTAVRLLAITRGHNSPEPGLPSSFGLSGARLAATAVVLRGSRTQPSFSKRSRRTASLMRARPPGASPVCLPESGAGTGIPGEERACRHRAETFAGQGETTERRGLSLDYRLLFVTVQIPFPAPVAVLNPWSAGGCSFPPYRSISLSPQALALGYQGFPARLEIRLHAASTAHAIRPGEGPGRLA